MDDKSSAVKLLGQKLRVNVADGRILIGTFQCLDRENNIVLGDTVEHHQKPGVTIQDDDGKHTYTGCVLIPGKHVLKVYTPKQTEDS